jgi:hypothetical protein
MTDILSPSKSSRELKNNYRTFLLTITNEIKNNYRTLPLTITDEITNGLSPSESFKEFEKTYKTYHC